MSNKGILFSRSDILEIINLLADLEGEDKKVEKINELYDILLKMNEADN